MKPTIEELHRMVTALELSDEQFEDFKSAMHAALDVCVALRDSGSAGVQSALKRFLVTTVPSGGSEAK
jgi:hypothetical protein